MIEKIMKAVKSSNKRRGRNITIGAVIGFLLSCTAVAGADEYLYIKDDSGIQFSTDSTNGADGDWSGSNPYEGVGNVWNENTYVNNIALSGTDNGANDTSGNPEGYGVKLKLSLEEVKFINNGAISAESTSSNAYGIDNVAGSKISLINNGTISASSSGAMATYSNGINNSGIITNLDNSGIVYGVNTDVLTYSNGIYNTGTINKLNNNGILLANKGLMVFGISNDKDGIIDKLNNNGKILSTTGTDYGISNDSLGSFQPKITILSNKGFIGGDSSVIRNGAVGIIDTMSNYGVFSSISSTTVGNGYGIWNRGTIETINNAGVVYGKEYAINNQGGTIDTANNYGILVNGKNQTVNNGIINNMSNYGLIIRNEGVVIPIAEGIGGEQYIPFYDKDGKEVKRKMTIENKTDATGNTSFEGNQTNKILNVLKNTYKVTGLNDEVTGSIINAYGTAVVFEGKDKKLTLSGIIVNGGIENSTNGIAISGSNNGDTLILQSGTVQYTNGSEEIQNTIVNGNIDMGAGNDTLTIGDGTIVNGTLDGGDGEDILNFGVSGSKSNSSESEGVRILHNITGFENMNINTNVTLFEKTIGTDGKETNLEVTGVESIKIGKDGNLILRIDGTNGNSHALSTGNTSGTIESDGGKLLLGLNGVGENTTIDIGMNLGDSMYGVENKDIIYGDKFTLDTTSALHSVEKTSNTEVLITTKSKLPVSPDTPEDVNYEKLDKIYQSMRETNQVKEFNVTKTDESLASFSSYLHDLYAGNPYSYSSELSRKSVGMFRDIATENQFKPELNKWLIMGGLTHVDGGTKDTYYGKGYYTYDIGSSDMDVDTKITGAYMLGEYGVSDTLTYGVVIGGNKLKSDLSNGSKVDGDALYMGAYAKKYIGNLKVTGGLGLQYGDYDADRLAAGRGITETRSYSDNYNDMTYDIYLNGRYSHNIGNNLFLEPYGTLSYTYIKQDSADEGNKVLAIETDSKTFDYTAAKVGVDLKKVIPHEKGKSTLSAGVSYTRLLTGADEENITGRFKGGSDFDILVAHKNEHSIGLNAKYALELENGILFDVKGSYNVERDSHNGSGKNRAKGEWIVGAGIGYKF
ncbi:autotransporter family protein [Fusobacterium varium]